MNKKLHFINSLLFGLILICLAIIIIDIGKLAVIGKITFFGVECFLIFSVCTSFVIATIYIQKFEDCKHDLAIEKDFNRTWINSLYLENKVLKDDLATLKKENEMLSIVMINPSGKKMN